MSLTTLPQGFLSRGDAANALARLDPKFNAGQRSRFAEGIRAGFGVISLKGKTWSVIYQGQQNYVMRPDSPNEVASSMDVVLVDSGKGLSKVYYEDSYVEGSDAAPDCFSNDGVRPDPSSAKIQCEACALCPHNIWGSKVTDQGKKTKACADSKRVAVVPLPHESLDPATRARTILNEEMGGAFLLRIPAASMADLANYETQMRGYNYGLHMVGTKLAFDHLVAYPRVVYAPVRPLTEEEFQAVLQVRDAMNTRDMLALGDDLDPAMPVAQAPAHSAPAPAPQAPAPQAPAPQAPAPQAPAPQAPAPAPAPEAPKPQATARPRRATTPAPAQAAPAAAPANVPANPFGGGAAAQAAAPVAQTPMPETVAGGDVYEGMGDQGEDTSLDDVLANLLK